MVQFCCYALLPPPPLSLFLTSPGGCNQSGQPINDAEVFDFSSKKWNAIHQMPTKRAASKAAIVREGKIIIVGGVTDKQKPLKTVDCYNITSNSWEAFPPLPVGVTGKPHPLLVVM